jgi:DNA invertase Pin-like site-specific DNA recombinase
MIAQRTKDALQAAKARGVVLGNPRLFDVRGRALASVKADAERFARNIAPIIRQIQSTALHQIAALHETSTLAVSLPLAVVNGPQCKLVRSWSE